MQTRTIQQLAYGTPMDMGGFPIRQAIPNRTIDQLDPFLLLHHANLTVDKNINVLHAGVGPHPHRGFSPVTFIFEGGVHHRDSRGNNNIVYAGGTQWMNAGMGIIHSERPPANIHELGSRQELIQLWINTPAKHKMDQPVYMPLTADNTPVVKSNDNNTTIQVIAGKLHDVIGPIKPQSPINMFTVNSKKDVTYFLPIEEAHHLFVYILNGKISIAGKEVPQFNMAILNNDGTGIALNFIEDSILLVGSGEPLNEPVASHGPFVMNSETQLMEAFRDYQLGKMGVLIEQ